MDENSIYKCNKLLWDLMAPKEIKEALRDEKSFQKNCRRSSICTELPLRTIYAKSPLANYFIREHFFQNRSEKYYQSYNQNIINNSSNGDQDEEVHNTENLLNMLNSEMELLDLENCELNTSPNNLQSDASSSLSDESSEEEAVNKGFYECEDRHNECCEKVTRNVRRATKFERREFNDTLDEMNLLLENPSTVESGLIKCSSLNQSGISFVKTEKWTNSAPASTIKTALPHQSKQIMVKPATPNNKNVVKASNLKGIRSPVGIYIKNPSTLPPIQHISVNPLIKKKLFEKSITKVQSNKENVNYNLPLHVYKPAKHKILSKQSTVKLPSNIQKRIPTTPKVIKHSRRITKKKICGASLEIELLKENLTNICDTSALNSTSSSVQEISVLSTKEEYIK